MLFLLPPDKISALTGLAQAGQVAGAHFGANWLSPCFALLITISVIKQLTAFVAGNTRLPFALGLDHYLPAAFAKLHPRWRTPHVSILAQGILASVLLLLMQLGETLRAAYQILVDLTVIATFLPFGLHLRQRIQVRTALGRSIGRPDHDTRHRPFGRCRRPASQLPPGFSS